MRWILGKMKMITYEYGQTEQPKAERCAKCGAPVYENNIIKEFPFYYGGFMIWPELDLARDLFIFHIWQGDRRIHVIELSRQILRDTVPAGYSYASYILDLIKLAIGEKEVLEIQTMNDCIPVKFEIKMVAPAHD
jgi:hypothetical protein